MTYKNFKELYGGILNYNDKIIFNYKGYILKYTVTRSYLGLEDTIPSHYNAQHDFIFQLLGLNRFEVCNLIYNTKGNNYEHCIFPETKKGDYESLTNITLFLFSKIENIKFEKYNIWGD